MNPGFSFFKFGHFKRVKNELFIILFARFFLEMSEKGLQKTLGNLILCQGLMLEWLKRSDCKSDSR